MTRTYPTVEKNHHSPRTTKRGRRVCPRKRNPTTYIIWASRILQKSSPFSTISPPHAFPHTYPPPVRPESITFVTHIPLLERGAKREPRATVNYDVEGCISALARLSLGPPPTSRGSAKPPKTSPKPPSRADATPGPKLTSQLSPSRPRLVSPMLDTSVAVSYKHFPGNGLFYPLPINTPRAQNIDIPRPNRRKVCSIPYRRPTVHPSASPESPSPSSFSRSIRRTPSLTSDHGSEASSPSTPPDFPSLPTPASTPAHKGSFSEATSPSEHSSTRHSGWHSIDFGTNIYG